MRSAVSALSLGHYITLPRVTPTWMFVPNQIGYARIFFALLAFLHALPPSWEREGLAAAAAQAPLFVALYFASYILDAFDGLAARALKQTSSFGALLDMAYTFLCLLMLDVVSHWVQMYSAMAAGASHKALAGEHWLVSFYYTFPYALFVVCLLSETCLVSMFMLKYEATFTALMYSLVDSLTPLVFAERVSLVRALLCLTFPVFCMKQLFSVLQGATALRRVLAMDDAARS